jgi:ABC-2 type transport system permease protein
MIGFALMYVKLPQEFDEKLINKLKGSSFPITVLSSISDLLLPILITLLVTSTITDEYNNGTLKLPLLHGNTRLQILNAKIISVVFLVFTLFLGTLIFAYIFGAIVWGNSTLRPEKVIYTIKIFGLTLIPFIAFIIAILFISLKVSNSGILIAIIVTILLLSSLLSDSLTSIRPFLLTYYLKVFSIGVNENVLVKGCIVSCVYGFVFYILSKASFLRMEIEK